ncbi:hypothetical protein FGG08_001041 [Glutinoglossum americanum]|uniref:GH16 domain-containing protein n=1 Tax=Glutinoglossum americanum TaxID=1670608 RepID=A0A9P8L6G5_9PEZI|nr:hypothetical protein FGG08_001041 [Glutinoglossum americanum]
MPIPGLTPPPVPPHRVPPRRVPPHVTLNTENQDIPSVNTASSSWQQGRPGQGASRSLIPQNRPPVSPSIRNQRSAGAMYTTQAGSSELLLPPPGRDRRLLADSPSRRSSWDSDMGPFASPFDDSRAPSRAGGDEDYITTQTVSEKFAIMPSAGLLLFPDEVEKDDWLHNPDPNEKEERECDIFSRRGFVNVGGLGLLTLGLMFLFVGYPVITFYRNAIAKSTNPCDSHQCLDVGKVPLLKNIRKGLIDPDTPQSAMSKKSIDGSTLNLVFSDEFNTPNRTFYPGDDPYFQAMDLWYGVTEDLEWYDPDAITTQDGTLVITFDEFQNHNLNYRSGMLQSWNQLCFKGGLLEASISLPGKGQVSGFWPGFWAMGNLGRPGYASSTHGMWPYSYWDKCDAGITKNQSTPDGLSFLPGMRLPACTCKGEDHPTPGKSRSAPEIDAIEASSGFLGPGQTNPVGTASQSAQFAPFDIWYQPNYDYVELYNSSITQMNAYRGGVYQQALSGLSTLNNDWYDGNQFQTYSFEYTPGGAGSIVWYVGNEKTWKLDARAIGPNGNIGQRVMPEEPMSIVANFGMSNSFAPVDLVHLKQLFPSHMRLDYIRIYQKPGSESVTCDPPGYETTAYIKNHADIYSNPNITSWYIFLSII